IHTAPYFADHFLFNSHAGNLRFEASFLAALANNFVVEERRMSEFARETRFAVKQLAVGNDADGHSAAEMQVEHVLFRPRIARKIFGITPRPRIVFQQHPDARGLFDDAPHGLLHRCEVHVAAARLGIHAAGDAHPHPEYLAAVNPTAADETVDAPA